MEPPRFLFRFVTAPGGILALFAVFAILATSCGGDDDDSGDDTPSPASTGTVSGATTPAATATGDASSATSAAGTSPGGPAASGTFLVDGEAFNVDQVRRCEPFFGHDDDLDLTAVARGAMLFVTINHPIAANASFEMFELTVQGSAVRQDGGVGVFNRSVSTQDGTTWQDEDGVALPGAAPYERDANSIRGALTLNDSRGSTDTVEVSFDISIPDDIIDC